MAGEVEEIKSRLNIIDVLGEYIRLEKAGANHRATCPFHNEKSPSFMVSEEKQMWHCFGCGKGGDVFSFVMEMEGLEFRDALKLLAEKAGVELKSHNLHKAEQKNRTLEIMELATKWYEYQLWNGPGKVNALPYLSERGLKDETIKEFRLGYAPKGWRNMLTFLTKRGYKIDEISRTGLLVEKTSQNNDGGFVNSDAFEDSNQHYDRFRERIMFPVADFSGKVLGYSARVAPGGDESHAKYVNSPETEVYHKSRILYGIDKAKQEIKSQDNAVLVEGNMDVIACHQAGIGNAVAISGTALTQDQIQILKRYSRKVKMFFDMDTAGQIAARKSLKLGLENELEIRIISLPQGKDAAELAREDVGRLRQAVESASPAVEYFFQKEFKEFDPNDVSKKKAITENILEIISWLANDVEKSHWLKKLGEEVQTSETALTDMLKKATLKNRIQNDGSDTEPKTETFLTKTEVLTRELVSLMLVESQVWKETEKKARGDIFLPEDSLLNLMLERGESVNYDFDRLVSSLNDQRELQLKAEKIFFQKKYQLDLNNNPEEIAINDPAGDLEACLEEMAKEKKKNDLIHITSDLKLAETHKDKAAIDFLRHEYDKISKELALLLK